LPSPAACADLERRVAGARLDSRKWHAFRHVARYRAAAKLDPLPGFPACESVASARAELARDRRTVSILRRAGLSQTDYLLTGWAAIVARYPEDYPGLTGASATWNRSFVEAHRAEIDALFRSQ
jgi:hypothetical protein